VIHKSHPVIDQDTKVINHINTFEITTANDKLNDGLALSIIQVILCLTTPTLQTVQVPLKQSTSSVLLSENPNSLTRSKIPNFSKTKDQYGFPTAHQNVTVNRFRQVMIISQRILNQIQIAKPKIRTFVTDTSVLTEMQTFCIFIYLSSTE
jgi:hypothetical protein